MKTSKKYKWLAVIGVFIVLSVIALSPLSSKFMKGFVSREILVPVTIGKYVTKAQMIRMTIETTGVPTPTITTQHYDDVPPSHPYYRDIETAVYYNWIDPILPGRRANPDSLINRAVFARFVTSVFEIIDDSSVQGTPAFSDVREDVWYHDAVSSLYAAGAVKVAYKPEDRLDRGSAQEVLNNLQASHPYRIR